MRVRLVRSKSLFAAELAVGVERDMQDEQPAPHCPIAPDELLLGVVVVVLQLVEVDPLVLHPVSVEHVVLQLAVTDALPTSWDLAIAVVGHTTSQFVIVSVSEQETVVVVANAETSHPETVLVDVVQDAAACLLRPGAETAEHST